VSSVIEPGVYRDAFDPNGLVTVLGEAVDLCTGAVRIVIQPKGERRMELVRPAEFYMPTTVKDGDGTAKIQRFVRMVGPGEE
jgi:hypothetical protein